MSTLIGTEARAPSPSTVAATGSPRAPNVDVLRAVAALAVVAAHAYSFGGRDLPGKAQYWYDVPLITLATSVWLFFGISGYVISRPFVARLATGAPLPDVRAYAIRRALRIFPLFWIALTIAITITGVGATSHFQLAAHYLLLNNLIPGQQAALFSVTWTLTVEAIFYIIVPVLAVAVRMLWPKLTPERLAVLVIGSWLASIAFTVLGDLHGDGVTGLWLRGSFPAMWQAFCPGIIVALAPHLKAPAWRRWLVEFPASRAAVYFGAAVLIVGALLGAAAPLRWGIDPYQFLVDSSRTLCGIGYGLLIAAAVRRPVVGARHRWLYELGLISYGIYLMHGVILEFLIAHPSLVPFRDTGVPAFAVHTALLAALTIPLAALSWRFLEQPLIEVGRRLSARITLAERPPAHPR